MSTALKNYNRKATAQTVQDSADQVRNNAGGYVFAVADRDRLERFLILGTDGGTYYVTEQKLTQDNIKFLSSMIRKDEQLVLDTILDVSVNGRAFRNSPALFALALVFTEGQNKAAARAALPQVARTSTHLFEFAQYIENLGGWGRAKRSAVADWYTDKSVEQIAYQMVKYRQRNGWTHRDLLRLSHPVGLDANVVNFALGKDHGAVPSVIEGFEAAQSAESVKDVVRTIDTYKNLPWEAIPTQFLKDEKVWKALFYSGQIKGQALVRNVVRLARIGAFKDLTFAADYAAALVDADMIAKTRLHPINYLNALVVYTEGQVDRTNGYYSHRKVRDWNTVGPIQDALDAGFYEAFKSVESAGKRTFIGVDVSGSMASMANGIDLSCAQVSAAMAMTIARTEPAYEIRGFTSGGGYYSRRSGTELTDLKITARTSLNTAMSNVQKSNFGGTDCALPMLYAAANRIEVDHFCVITDNETWAGNVKPHQALKQYRQKMGIDAKLSVLGVATTGFTIADPSDRGMMDFVGFDSNTPKVLADFAANRI